MILDTIFFKKTKRLRKTQKLPKSFFHRSSEQFRKQKIVVCGCTDYGRPMRKSPSLHCLYWVSVVRVWMQFLDVLTRPMHCNLVVDLLLHQVAEKMGIYTPALLDFQIHNDLLFNWYKQSQFSRVSLVIKLPFGSIVLPSQFTAELHHKLHIHFSGELITQLVNLLLW